MIGMDTKIGAALISSWKKFVDDEFDQVTKDWVYKIEIVYKLEQITS